MSNVYQMTDGSGWESVGAVSPQHPQAPPSIPQRAVSVQGGGVVSEPNFPAALCGLGDSASRPSQDPLNTEDPSWQQPLTGHIAKSQGWQGRDPAWRLDAILWFRNGPGTLLLLSQKQLCYNFF